MEVQLQELKKGMAFDVLTKVSQLLNSVGNQLG